MTYHNFLHGYGAPGYGAPVPPVCSSGCTHWYTYTWDEWSSDSLLGRQLRNISCCSGWPGLFPSWLQWCEHCHFRSHHASPSV